MKTFLNIVVIAAALTLASCKYIHEDGYDCPPGYNLTVHFSNLDKNGREIFPSTVDAVDIFLFDAADDKLVYRFAAPQAELIASRSATLTVAPGNYRIVCWGNARSNTAYSLSTGQPIGEGYVAHALAPATSVQDGDPLYYGPFDRTTPQTFTVEQGQQQDVYVRMRAAHIKMDFIVRGYAAYSGSAANPYIEIANLYPKYDFTMGYLPTPAVSYVNQTRVSTRAGDATEQQFHTPRFENDNPVMIYVRRTPGGAADATVELKEELIARSIDVEDQIELTLAFEFAFSPTDVSVKIGGWEAGELQPDMW